MRPNGRNGYEHRYSNKVILFLERSEVVVSLCFFFFTFIPQGSPIPQVFSPFPDLRPKTSQFSSFLHGEGFKSLEAVLSGPRMEEFRRQLQRCQKWIKYIFMYHCFILIKIEISLLSLPQNLC